MALSGDTFDCHGLGGERILASSGKLEGRVCMGEPPQQRLINLPKIPVVSRPGNPVLEEQHIPKENRPFQSVVISHVCIAGSY